MNKPTVAILILFILGVLIALAACGTIALRLVALRTG